jgi:Cu+-exporting ATPase
VLVGTARLLESEGVGADGLGEVAAALAEQGQTAVLAAIDGRPAGVLGVTDRVKEGAAEAVRDLKAMGLSVVMLTGDAEATARAVAREVGIDDVRAEVLPADKAAVVEEHKADGRLVAMVGDGINDAPALATADVGIALGTGTDVAIEAADVALMKGDVRGVATAIRLSRRTMRTIRENLFWAFAYNTLGIPIAAGVLYPLTGLLLKPWIAAAAMAFSSVSVVTNSLRLRGTRI